MKRRKTLFAILMGVALLATTACKNEESYRAGFPTLCSKNGFFYANNTSDSLYVSSYGPWKITAQPATDWCTLELMSGKGYADYSFGIALSQNTTGQARTAQFRIEDTSHPSEAYMEWQFTQTATRGDGSMGHAPAVTSITGTDGSAISMSYDQLYRPLSLRIEKNGTLLRQLNIAYDDRSQEMTIDNNGGNALKGSYDNSYQPRLLASVTDTIGLYEQTYHNLFSRSYAFNIEEHQYDGSYEAFAYLVPNMSSHPDSLHNADSLRYACFKNGLETKERIMKSYKLSYSKLDNRFQTVDANQLLLGVEHCNPYMLLSLFRYARNSSIISEAICGFQAEDITVNAEVNSDKSVKTLTVKRNDSEITYTFDYAK